MKYMDLLFLVTTVPGVVLADTNVTASETSPETLAAYCAAVSVDNQNLHITLSDGKFLTIKCENKQVLCHLVSDIDNYSPNYKFSCEFYCPVEEVEEPLKGC